MRNLIKKSTAGFGFIIMLMFTMLLMNCSNPKPSVKIVSQEHIFPKGRLAPSDFFIGNVYVTGLIDNDSVLTTTGGEVYFEMGARSNWHLHPAGQILIVTAGVGYHQIRGQAIEIIHKGDVIKCPPNVDHWHGASKDASMSHIYIVPNTEKGIVEWKESVTDEEYLSSN